MASIETLAAAVAAAARFWSAEQSGPKPGSREALYLATLLREAEARLKASGENAP